MTKSKYRQSGVLVWFLDNDLQKSAEYLTNAAFAKTIDGCFSVLVTAVLHFSGIRNKKMYEYAFSRDRRDETMHRLFPSWPFRKTPQLKYYTNRTAKWARMCREHFDYVKKYFDVLLDEYEYRFGRRHKLANFSEWVDEYMPQKVPYGNLKHVSLPWKSLKLKFRRKDVIEGYRLQYIDQFLWSDPIAAYGASDRDVPDFVVKYFHLDTASMIT